MHTLKRFCKYKLEIDGVLKQNKFWVKGVRESLSEESEEFLKTCHICYIKTKNTRFLRVR